MIAGNPTPKKNLTRSKEMNVLGSKMHYLEAGEGRPLLFLHGVPTSSYVWRNILPYLAPLGRCIAPDLIGFGLSDKPDISYSITNHIKYIDGFIEALNLKNLIIIMHGWGSIIGIDYAMRHENNCEGLVFYESFLRPLDKENISLPYQEQLHALQQQEKFNELASDGAAYVEQMISQMGLTALPQDEMTAYRQPFSQKMIKPLLDYLRELPKGNGQLTIDKLIDDYSKKLIKSKLPKLLLYSVPGFITTVATVMWAKEHLSHLEIVDVGEELHFAQESNPQMMGEVISAWLQGVRAHEK